MAVTHSFAGRQRGRFLVGWLIGVVLGTGLIGIGLFFGFSYLSSTPGQPVVQQTQTAKATNDVKTQERSQTQVATNSPTIDDDEAANVTADEIEQSESVAFRPSASAAPPSNAFVRTRNGEVLPVPEGETIDSVLDRHAREQNLSVAIDRAVNAADRAARTETPPQDIMRQQQEQIAASRAQDQHQRQVYEQRLRQQDADRRELMVKEDLRRGLDIEPDPEEQGEIAPRVPD